jgi:predicted ATP-dependent endonuclease of OLD family
LKQAKKIITRMLLNNWGGISHRMMEFHEYVNLFSGKSGSGKSTVMDAIQVFIDDSPALLLGKSQRRIRPAALLIDGHQKCYIILHIFASEKLIKVFRNPF